MRGLVAAGVAAGAAVFVGVGTIIPLSRIGQQSMTSFEGIEAALNILILVGLALAGLSRLESRVKRRRAAAGLHRLRAVIHVIDMHQLTKDPAALAADYPLRRESPRRDLDGPLLERYLDYCSELLSLTGKLAALYAQAVPDEGVAAAVGDIETLGSQLARKIWQKIEMIEMIDARAGRPASAPGQRRRRSGAAP